MWIMRIRCSVIWLIVLLMFLGGCQVLDKKTVDGNVLEYTIADEQKIPEEMAGHMKEIEEKLKSVLLYPIRWIRL